jgi:hypothetical protein
MWEPRGNQDSPGDLRASAHRAVHEDAAVEGLQRGPRPQLTRAEIEARNAKVRDAQRALVPKEDLSAYAGRWVALRHGRVIADGADARTLRDRSETEDGDLLMHVGQPGHRFHIF